MKFIKRLALNRKDPMSNRFAVQADDRIVTTSKVSLQLPSGTTGDRPSGTGDGRVRFNTTKNETEIYNANGTGQNAWDSPWEQVLTNRQHAITVQNLGVGDALNSFFGPLAYDIDTSKPQNILVFIENVWQTPNTNYTLLPGTLTNTSTFLALVASTGSTTLTVATLTNIIIGMTVTGPGSQFAGNTTVTSIVTATQAVGISLATLQAISTSTLVTFSETAGTFIQFDGPVPWAKPVYAILGLDGYSP